MKRESIINKLKELSRIKTSLVLVQQHELELMNKRRKLSSNQSQYVENLHKHYIVNKKPKTYLT